MIHLTCFHTNQSQKCIQTLPPCKRVRFCIKSDWSLQLAVKSQTLKINFVLCRKINLHLEQPCLSEFVLKLPIKIKIKLCLVCPPALNLNNLPCLGNIGFNQQNNPFSVGPSAQGHHVSSNSVILKLNFANWLRLWSSVSVLILPCFVETNQIQNTIKNSIIYLLSCNYSVWPDRFLAQFLIVLSR